VWVRPETSSVVAGGQPSRPAAHVTLSADSTALIRPLRICKACEHSRDNAFACALHRTCCFGRWRSGPANHCPANLW
ncbi:MAG: hypothetical protein ACOC8H_00750, partial [bacterium]